MEQIRTIKRLNDGAVKRMKAGAAARLISKGGYQYVDGGPNDVIEPDRNTFIAKEFSRRDAEIVQMKSLPIETPTNKIIERNSRAPKTIKTAQIPPARLEQIRAVNMLVTEQAQMTPGRDSTALKNLIEKTKTKRSRTTKVQVQDGEEE